MKKKGDYTTKGRTEILSFLEDNKEKGVTVRDIACHMENSGASVNPTTIYRYLDKLNTEGIVVKHVSAKGKKATFQLAKKPQSCHSHLHIQCKCCGRVVHLDCSFMKEIEAHILEHHGYTLDCSDSILHGLCQQCKNQ